MAKMVLEVDSDSTLHYSWLPLSSSSTEEINLADLTSGDLMSQSKAAANLVDAALAAASLEMLNSSAEPDKGGNKEEFINVITPITEPFDLAQTSFDNGKSGRMDFQGEGMVFSVGDMQQNGFFTPFSPVMNAGKLSSSQHIGTSVEKTANECSSSWNPHFSPVSTHSLADSGVSSVSENPPANQSSTPSYLDFDFDQIVDEVDDMFRERDEAIERRRADEDKVKTQDLIRRTMPPEYFITYPSKNPQELAEDLAKSLIEKALESDRRKYVQDESSINVDEITENYAEVAANRALEVLLEETVGSVLNDIVCSIRHGYDGNFNKFKAAVSGSDSEFINTSETLQDELEDLVGDFLAENDENCGDVPKKLGLYQILGPSRIYDYRLSKKNKQKNDERAFINRWKGSTHTCTESCRRTGRIFVTARMRREMERKRRNRAGILVSTLKKKVYHCRCIDCQEERRTNGLPEPPESIEVRELNVPENILPKDGIPLPKKEGRGRPRKYPRVEDFRRWVVEQQQRKNEILEVNREAKLINEETIKAKSTSKEEASMEAKRLTCSPSTSTKEDSASNKEKLILRFKRKRGRPPKFPETLPETPDCESSDEGYSDAERDLTENDDEVWSVHSFDGSEDMPKPKKQKVLNVSNETLVPEVSNQANPLLFDNSSNSQTPTDIQKEAATNLNEISVNESDLTAVSPIKNILKSPEKDNPEKLLPSKTSDITDSVIKHIKSDKKESLKEVRIVLHKLAPEVIASWSKSLPLTLSFPVNFETTEEEAFEDEIDFVGDLSFEEEDPKYKVPLSEPVNDVIFPICEDDDTLVGKPHIPVCVVISASN